MVVFNTKGEKKSDCRKVKEPRQQRLLCELSSGLVVCKKKRRKKKNCSPDSRRDLRSIHIKYKTTPFPAGVCRQLCRRCVRVRACVCGRVLKHVCLSPARTSVIKKPNPPPQKKKNPAQNKRLRRWNSNLGASEEEEETATASTPDDSADQM